VALKMALRGMSLFMVLAALDGTVGAAEDDPLLRPIAPDYARRWLAPQAPVRIHGNAYLVGFGGLSVGLIKTSAGLILIDGAVPQAVRDIEANIARLGFRLKDVKYILSTEPHYDHSGGIAALERDTGATVVASASAAKDLRAGTAGSEDPQATILERFPAVRAVKVVRDGETIRLGDVTVTAVATPGHTPGSMSWRWQSCEMNGGGKSCVPVIFSASLNPISADEYRFTEPAHRGLVTAFRASFAKMRGQRCGILLTSHPDQSGGDEKLKALLTGRKPNPFIDAGACRAYADRFEKALDERLKQEGSE